ncbi:Uncharacterised protein [Mycobacteroides abscessus]|nr:Uncharacterised protein [Mycobacteroides abscessus]
MPSASSTTVLKRAFAEPAPSSPGRPTPSGRSAAVRNLPGTYVAPDPEASSCSSSTTRCGRSVKRAAYCANCGVRRCA